MNHLLFAHCCRVQQLVLDDAGDIPSSHAAFRLNAIVVT